VIAATASDNVGVKKVEFWVNGTRKCSDNSVPYSCSWGVPTARGLTYTLEARAYDAAGNIASQSISVLSGLDTTPPTVSITSPASTAAIVIPVGANVTLSASASDDVGVTKVEFWVNGSRKCSDNTAPYTCVWKVPNTAGVTYIIEARAYDVSGNVARQSVIAVSQ
jgi:chitinase